MAKDDMQKVSALIVINKTQKKNKEVVQDGSNQAQQILCTFLDQSQCSHGSNVNIYLGHIRASKGSKDIFMDAVMTFCFWS